MMVYIYTFPNGKKYVGQTSQTLNQRAKNGEGYIESPAVYNAIQKYGWNNIKIEIFPCKTKEEMDQLERDYISFYNTNNSDYGYNLTLGGEGALKYNHEEVKTLWDSGLSVGEIAQQLECQHQTVHNILIIENSYDAEEVNRRKNKILSIKNGKRLNEYYETIDHQQQRIQNGLKGAAARSKKVAVYKDRDKKQLVGIYNSGRQAAKALNLNHSIPSYALNHSHYGNGYYFYFYDQENANDEFI